MRVRASLTLFAITVLIASTFIEVADAKVKKNHARATAAEDPAPPPPSTKDDKKGKAGATKTKVSFLSLAPKQ